MAIEGLASSFEPAEGSGRGNTGRGTGAYAGLMSSDVVACPACGARNRVPASASGTPRCAKCHAPLPWVVAADETSFDSAVDASVPVLLDLWAPWCAPCRMVSPILERLAGENAGRLKLVKVDVDQSPRVMTRFGVQAIPTLVILKGGREVSRQQGAGNRAQLSAWIGRHLT